MTVPSTDPMYAVLMTRREHFLEKVKYFDVQLKRERKLLKNQALKVEDVSAKKRAYARLVCYCNSDLAVFEV